MNAIRFRQKILDIVRQSPSLFFPLIQVRQRLGYNQGLAVLTPETDLVIEGYFRCGNSFATQAFIQSQPSPVQVANRTHAPAIVIRAAQWWIPTLILIREPVDTVLSLALKHPHLSLRQCVEGYCRYYQRIQPYRDHYVVATFEAVTTDFGQVIGRVNQRFGTSFQRFIHNPENVQRIMDHIEQRDRQTEQGDRTRYSVPTAEKAAKKAALRESLERNGVRPLIERAAALYADFLGYQES
jgi:hypothetical protein